VSQVPLAATRVRNMNWAPRKKTFRVKIKKDPY